jgi:phage-related protein
MLNETFYIDGVDARHFGIYLQKPIEFSEAVPVVEIQSIPGRNGDLIFDTGNYENRTGVATCFCLQKDVEKAISAAGRFLMGKKGYRRLETSDDPDHFWMARIENSPQITQRMRMLAPFEIRFDCKPQRFLKSGEEKIILDSFDGIVKNVYNRYGFPSRPLIHAHWISERDENASESDSNNFIVLQFFGELDKKRSVSARQVVEKDLYIDCDIHDAYNESGNQNRHISAYEFPTLEPGENSIGILQFNLEYVEITPRWWEL